MLACKRVDTASSHYSSEIVLPQSQGVVLEFEQNACVFARQDFPRDDLLVDLSLEMPAQPVFIASALQLPLEVFNSGVLKSIPGLSSGFPQHVLEVVDVPSACEAEELPKRTCARTALLLAGPAASLSFVHDGFLDAACR